MAGTTNWKAGFKKGSVWGTAVAVGALDGILVSSEGMPEGVPEPIQDENVGQALTNPPLQGNVSTEGNFEEIVRFEGFERRLALFMGADVVTVKTAAQSWEHSMIFQPSNDGKFGTLVIDKSVGANQQWEYPSCKLTQLELSHNESRLVANWNVVANKCERASAVNLDAQIAALTYPSTGLMAIFQQATVKLKEVTGSEGNLAGGDEILCSAISFSANRNLSGDYVCGTKAGTIDEPQTDGLPEAQFMITVPQYNATIDTIIKAAQLSQTGRAPKRYKCQVLWEGITIPTATEKYSLFLELPTLITKTVPVNAGGPGSKVPVELTFQVATPDANGNGSDWTWVLAGSTPFRARIYNKNSSSMA